MVKRFMLAALHSIGLVALLFLGLKGFGAKLAPLGALFDPLHGTYQLARMADGAGEAEIKMPNLQARVTLKRDERNVPHIFAENDADAIKTFGYVTAQDRLFQWDFIPRVAQGRLSEILGADFIERDRMLRSTGMNWGAEHNLTWLKANKPEVMKTLTWFCEGVNAYLADLPDGELPLEFRLLNYRPEACTPLRTLLILQYMSFDLSWKSDNLQYEEIRQAFGKEAFDQLFPELSPKSSPISPEPQGYVNNSTARPVQKASLATVQTPPNAQNILAAQLDLKAVLPTFMEDGIGSNNWTVNGGRSATGMPILAGDPHLSVTVPSIWYEVHLKTPTMNTHGVAVPGTPLPVIGHTDFAAWTFTNTDIDQTDFYAVKLDAKKKQYQYQNQWRALTEQVTEIKVKGASAVQDTLRFTHWGPLVYDRERPNTAIAVQWTVHKPNQTVVAIWGFNHAKSYDDFQTALKSWDSPMQNCLYADRLGNIAVRSAGYMPIRKGGYAGGLLDGNSDAGEWIGRVPYEELPSSHNPERGWLGSANQQPAGNGYKYYQRITWADAFRALRLDSLMAKKASHTVADLKSYHSDVKAVQLDFMRPILQTPQTGDAERIRQMLLQWDGITQVDRTEPLVLDVFLSALRKLTWDEFDQLDQKLHKRLKNPRKEDASRELVRRPEWTNWVALYEKDLQSSWFDRKDTPAVESGADLLKQALAAAADSLKNGYGRSLDRIPKWGDVHKIRFNHTLAALKPLGRGPFPFPGFNQTLSPAGGRLVSHTASWRMVVDFSNGEAKGYGVFPGGASGNPFSRFYDSQIATFLAFDYYPLSRAEKPDGIEGKAIVFSP